jgi:hypothetical protein
MEYKCLYGSKILKLDNCADEDWITFVDNTSRRVFGGTTQSYQFYSKRVDNFIKGRNVDGDAFKALFLYQMSKGFHDDPEYPFDFNILEHKDVWAKCLKTYVNLPRVEQSAIQKGVLPKKFYHLLYQLSMLTEDVHFISAEAKAEVQKIHDLEMPSSYFYELRELINDL